MKMNRTPVPRDCFLSASSSSSRDPPPLLLLQEGDLDSAGKEFVRQRREKTPFDRYVSLVVISSTDADHDTDSGQQGWREGDPQEGGKTRK